MFTCSQLLSFTLQRCSWKHQRSCCVFLVRSLPLSEPHSYMLNVVSVSMFPKVYCLLVFRPSGMGAAGSGVFFLCEGERMTGSYCPFFPGCRHISLWFLTGPRAPHASSWFSGLLATLLSSWLGEMVLVLGRVSIFKGPNIPGATCFSGSQVIIQSQMDGLGIRHHCLSGVTSHLWLVVVVTEQIDIYGIVFLSPSFSLSLSFFF